MKKIDNYYGIGFSRQRAFLFVTLSGLFSGVISSVLFVFFATKNPQVIESLGSDMTKIYLFLVWLSIAVVFIIGMYNLGGLTLSRSKKK